MIEITANVDDVSVTLVSLKVGVEIQLIVVRTHHMQSLTLFFP